MPINIKDSIESSTIKGSLNGNASTATKATQDSAGQQINKTYIKGLSVSGKTITYTKGDGTTGTITTQDTNTTYSTGTASALGLTKLYTGTGTATDGTMTQSAIKTALDGKAASSHTHSYLPLSGGTMTGNLTMNNSYINFATNNTGIQHGGVNILKNNGTSTVLSSKTASMHFRPNGDGNATGEFAIHKDGAAVVDGNVTPKTNNTRTLGTTGLRWNSTWTNKINEFVVGATAAQRFNSIPVINSGGVMEMGWTIDFHKTNTNGTDFNARLQISNDETFTFTNGLYPAGQDRFELGNANRRWRSAYFSGNVNAAAHVNNSERDSKTNIKDFDKDKAYEEIKKLNVYTYNYKIREGYGEEIIVNEDGSVEPPKNSKKNANKFNQHTHMGIMVDEAPKEIISEDGTGIDIYGFASYTASALKVAIEKIEKLEKLLNVTGTN